MKAGCIIQKYDSCQGHSAHPVFNPQWIFCVMNQYSKLFPLCFLSVACAYSQNCFLIKLFIFLNQEAPPPPHF
jgi:hypothetical protein